MPSRRNPNAWIELAGHKFSGVLFPVAAAALVLYYTRNVVWAVAATFFSKLLILLSYDSGRETFRLADLNSAVGTGLVNANRLIERFRPKWNIRSQWEMLWCALPLGAVSILSAFNVNIPRYVIEHYLGARDLGIYSALNYIPQAAIMIATALGYVTFARLSKLYFVRDVRGFRVLLGTTALISAVLGVIAFVMAAFAGPMLLRLLYRPEYAEHSDLLLWLVATGGVACVATCVGCAMTAASQFRPQIPLFAVVTAVSAVTALALVPRLGLYGAAIANLASMTVQLLGTCFILHRALVTRRSPAPQHDAQQPAVAKALAES